MGRRPKPGTRLDTAARRKMDALYAELPKLECKGRCQDSCGPIEMTPVERRRIEATGTHIPELSIARFKPGCEDCSALDFAGRCSVYDIRPMICRLWGVTEAMPCPFGCVPEGGHISREEGFEFLRRSFEIGGPPPGWERIGPISKQDMADMVNDPGMGHLLDRIADDIGSGRNM